MSTGKTSMVIHATKVSAISVNAFVALVIVVASYAISVIKGLKEGKTSS